MSDWGKAAGVKVLWKVSLKREASSVLERLACFAS